MNGGAATTFAFWSHKGLRWTGPFLLLGAMVSSIGLGAMNPWFLPLAGGFAGVFLMAAADRFFGKRNGPHVKLFRFARYFLSMNLAPLPRVPRFPEGTAHERLGADPARGIREARRACPDPEPALRR